MTGRYQAYSEYQSTDDVHIKQLPTDWVMKPLGLVAAKGRTSFVDGPFGSDLKSNEYQDEGIPLIQLNNITIGKHILQNMKYITEEKMHQLSRHIAKPNDIVIAKMADPVARATVVNDKFEKYVIVADCVKLTVDTSIVDLSYVTHAINSKEVNSSAELVSTGTTRIRINLTELKNLKIPFPPLVVQQKIANFIDHETSKIDTLIAKQEKLIELLKEKRQSVISHAVTKGLYPNTPMKDSGVEWLGEVPEHWVVSPLKYYSKMQGGFAFSSDDFSESGVQLLKIANVYQNRLALERQPTFLNESYLSSHKDFVVTNGDILMSLTGTLGKQDYGFAVLVENNNEFLLNQRVAKINADKTNILQEYLLFSLWSDSYLSQLYSLPSGTKQANLSNDDVMGIVIAFPSTIKEQEEIVQYVASKLERFKLLHDRCSKKIDLLKERKTALISAAVTGKIDVRNWQLKEVYNG